MTRSLVVVAAAALVTAAIAPLAGCDAPLQARCVKITSRAELIGGPRALGEVGDFLLENGKVRFIVQDKGFSRGFGVFGGALLDAELVRPEEGRGDSTGGHGKDNFGEMFPAFFLQALEPRDVDDPNHPGKILKAIEIASAGGEEDAVLVVRGTGNDFLALTQNLNETVLGDDRGQPHFLFETRYILHPGAQYLEMETRVQNLTPSIANLPNTELFGANVPTPFGDVMLFGSGNKVFLPHEAGFDIRFRLQEAYQAGGVALPALPGLVSEFVASAGPDVSYGLMPLAPKGDVTNFAYANRDVFPEATKHSIHIPFIASAFTGVFQVLPPPQLAPNDQKTGGKDEMKFSRIFIVGDGDVASISDVAYDVLGDSVGELQGRVTQNLVNKPVDHASVIVVDKQGNKVTQMFTNANGRFRANLRPGTYSLTVYKPGFPVQRSDTLKVETNQIRFADLVLPAQAELVVTVVEPGVGRIPAKASLIGIAPAGHEDDETRNYLFDLSVGEPFRMTDMVRDDPDDARTREYVEDFKYGADGVVRFKARPGKYRLVVGRGLEYSRFEKDVDLRSGDTETVTVQLERVVDTHGYVSGDFHLHSQFSLDSAATLDDRITSYAAEGVELAVSTDHNFVVDYQPTIEKVGLTKEISSIVGLELTTIDRGHFNGFPLSVQPGALVELNKDGSYSDENIASRTYGSFEWALRTPQEIFDDMRKLGIKDNNGKTKKVIVQANHPRDSITGYFNTYGLNPLDLEAEGPSGLIAPNPNSHVEFAGENFSFDFDSLEVFNGKRLDLLKTFAVPPNAPTLVVGTGVDRREVTVDPVTCCEVHVGDYLAEHPPFPCDDTISGDCETCDAAHFQRAQDEGTCDGPGTITFPGVVDDWFKMLEAGKHLVGTASSDSHEPESGEPGFPRTFLRAPSDEPAQLRAEDVVAAFDAGDVMLTNGPFLRVDVDGKGMGERATAHDGTVRFNIHVDSAPWVRVRSLRIRRGTEAIATLPVPRSGPYDTHIDVDVTTDTFLIVEAEGTDSLWPSIVMNEIPPLAFTDALGAIGSAFGLGADPRALKPSLIGITTPYAVTNPIYVDADGDGKWTATREIPVPGHAAHAAGAGPTVRDDWPARGRPWVETEAEARTAEGRALFNSMPLRKRLALEGLPMWLWPSNDPRDIRKVLIQFTRHAD